MKEWKIFRTVVAFLLLIVITLLVIGNPKFYKTNPPRYKHNPASIEA